MAGDGAVPPIQDPVEAAASTAPPRPPTITPRIHTTVDNGWMAPQGGNLRRGAGCSGRVDVAVDRVPTAHTRQRPRPRPCCGHGSRIAAAAPYRAASVSPTVVLPVGVDTARPARHGRRGAPGVPGRDRTLRRGAVLAPTPATRPRRCGRSRTVWPTRPFRWTTLQSFAGLERLTIAHAGDRPVALTALVIQRARQVTNGLVGLSLLRVLHFEDTNCESFTVAVGLPALASLTRLTPPLHTWHRLRDTSCLADVAPLARLVMHGKWHECPRVAMRVHHETLRASTELNILCGCYEVTTSWQFPAGPDMHHACTLRLGSHVQTDMAPLVALPNLERLQLAVAETVRCLTRLRELHRSNGEVCDLVGYVPRLETLAWGIRTNSSRARRTLGRRDTEPESVPSPSSTLRPLVLRGSVASDDSGDDIRAMLARVEQLERVGHARVASVRPSIVRLQHLARLAIRGGFMTSGWCEE